MATVVAIITSVVVANATQTFATPNAAYISYNLATNTDSAPITPVTNRAVLVMGCCTTSVDRGVGQVSLIHTPSPSAAIAWVGLDSPTSAAITQGNSTTAGTRIVSIDANHVVDIQVASADTIRVHNGNIATRAGNVTLVW